MGRSGVACAIGADTRVRQVHRLLGSAKFELRRIESGNTDGGEASSSLREVRLESNAACRVPAIYSPDSILRINGKRSPVIISTCFPSEHGALPPSS